MLQLSTRSCYILFRRFSSGYLAAPSEANTILERVGLLCTRGHLQEAISLFYTLYTPFHPHQTTYATLFNACARYGFFEQGLSLHHHMLAHNTNLKIPPDLFTTNHLVNMYCKFGCLDYAHQLFDEMPYRNIFSWTILISGYALHGRGDKCFRLFSDMLLHFRPTEFAFSIVLSSCGEHENERERGKQVHAIALKICYDAYVYVGNALITMYCKKIGYCNNASKYDAWTMFKTMEFRNLISWNSMITGFQHRGLWAQALNLFTQMHCYGIGVERATLLSVFSSLCGSNENFVDLGLNCCYQLHCFTVKTGFILEIEVTTALVKTYSNLGGEVADSYRLFSETSGSRDIVSWTGIITAFAERDPEQALFLFTQLLREELTPDKYTFSIVLKACAGLATERHALAVYSLVMKSGFGDDTVLANALIHAYARCGSIVLSKQVFDEMNFRDTVSWNSMLKAYALHGHAKESLQLLLQMNVQPDGATFVALLSACSHAGMVEEGTKIFDTMFDNYGIVPQLDHFACMVDLLGRAGRILEAEELIRKMPMEPDFVIWSSLLGSCRKHGETHLAKIAAGKLQKLEPKNSLGYVQISNMHCSGGSFNEAGLVRQEMKGSGVRKQPGLSWIEIENRVHEFASGGKRHPQREAICAMLEKIVRQLKEIGYVPETYLALHDIEEEHKEEQLYYHSEKLAYVFALINADSLPCGGGVIRIMKNIRICVDCHNFMKLASSLFGREIVVRDSNRFHHFKDRVCSCNDYW